jgi:hypothetical protein
MGGSNLGDGVVAARAGIFYYAGLAIDGDGDVVTIFSQSMDGGSSWSAPTAVAAPMMLTISQDKPWIAVDNTNGASAGNIYISWTQFYPAGSQIVCSTSSDGGKSFSQPVALSLLDNTFSVQGTNIAIGADGEVYIAWGDLRAAGIVVASSLDAGKSFQPEIDAVALANYQLIGPLLNSHFSANGLPSIAVDTSGGPYRGNIYIVFNAPSQDQPMDKSDVFLVSSSDRGNSWSALKKVNDDSGITDQFMPSVAVAIDGTVGIMWYDRRNDALHNGMIDVFATTSNDGGNSFNPNRRITTGNWLVLTTPVDLRSNYHGDYNQMSAFTDRPGFFYCWGDDRSGLDADVYAAQSDSKNITDTDANFNLTVLTPSQTLIAGQGAQMKLQVNRKNNFADDVNLSGSSDTSEITFEFNIQKGVDFDDVSILTRASANAVAGTHPIIVSVSSGGETITCTLRLNVVAPGQFARIPINVSSNAGRSIQPHIAVDVAGKIYAVWADDISGNFCINFSQSADGNNFSSPINISQSIISAIHPTIAVDSANIVHIVWQEVGKSNSTIKYCRSTDQGASFSDPILLSPHIDYSEFPSIITNPQGEVVIFWDGQPAFNVPQFVIYSVLSRDNGAHFSSPSLVANNSQRNFFTTAAASDGAGNSYLAYESCASGNCRIETKSSQDGFNTYTDGGVASPGLDFAIQPAVSAPGNGVVYVAMTVALANLGDQFEIYASSSLDNGASFAAPQNISNSPLTSGEATIIANKNKIYIAWMDETAGNGDIFLAVSQNNGISYSSSINVTNDSTISQVPTLAMDGAGIVHLLYEDESEGNDDTFYCRLDGMAANVAINAIEPSLGPPGTLVTVSGLNLDLATAVAINGQAAEFYIASAYQLVVVVPAGARSGAFTISTAQGTLNSAQSFTVSSGITATPVEIDFGSIIAGQLIAPRPIKISNFGKANLTISAIALADKNFRLINAPALPAQLAAGQALTISVEYFAAEAQTAQATLKIVSNDKLAANISISLQGSASAPVLSLLSPQGGEKLRAGDQFTINWQVANIIATGFDLMLSLDGGQSFTTPIALGLDATTRSFLWSVPASKTKTASVAVIMRAASGAEFLSQSQSNFKIKLKK